MALCGVSAEIQDALESEDESFYGLGFASETSSDSDADDESDSDTSGEPLAKRQDSAGIATGVTAAAAIARTSSSDDSDDKRLSTSTNSSVGESAAAASSPTPPEKKRGLLASDILGSVSHGYTCKKVNHWMKIPSRSHEDYMFDISQMERRKKKMFVLGVLTGCLRKSPTGGEEGLYIFFSYTVRGVVVCRNVFMEVHGVGTHLMKQLQNKAENGDVYLSPHGLSGKTPRHLSLDPGPPRFLLEDYQQQGFSTWKRRLPSTF